MVYVGMKTKIINQKHMKKIALITGATSGIGKATAVALAAGDYNLIITGRREDRLQELKAKLGVAYKADVLVLCFDIRDREAVDAAVASIPEAWRAIDVLVNNAGLAVGLSPIQEGLIDDWERMIDTNIKGLLYVTHAIAPLMTARGRGQIINIGSIAGREVYPNGNVYCATKFAVSALSRAMRMDMVKQGIKVTNVCPGAAETEFSLVRFKDDAERASATYNGITPLSGDDIAQVISFIVSLPPHVCINEIEITPTAQASATIFNRK